MSRIISSPQRILAEYPSCYACDERKVSREHVPPLCFFPDVKDGLGNSLYRINLMRVPSCDLHNTEKSNDDLYAAFHLAGTIRGNHCAELVRNSLLARRLENDRRERGGTLTKRLLSQIRGAVGENLFGVVDAQRMIRFLELCARGVYFYEKLKPLKLPLRVANVDYDFQDDPEKSQTLAVQRNSFHEEMSGCEYLGSNPDVFTYRICEKPERDVTMIELTFFGDLQRWAFYHPNAERQRF